MWCIDSWWRLSWSWSYGSWIYNYLCNQCLSIPPISTKRTITHLNWTHWTQKNHDVALEIQVLALGQAQKWIFNQLKGSQPTPLDNWISNSNTYINKHICKSTRRRIVLNFSVNKLIFDLITNFSNTCISKSFHILTTGNMF